MKKAAATINAISVGRNACASVGAASVLIDSTIPGSLGPRSGVMPAEPAPSWRQAKPVSMVKQTKSAAINR
jgi:hypothetical protein